MEFTQGEGGHESLLVRTGDPRKLLYGLAMLAAQHGYQSKLYPVVRDGRPLGEVTHKLVGAANGG
ncbi:MAG TPA: hypothetical protein PLO23_11425, partial [Alphaproteobacteria bacterium]|nr:hypothetical protein [Alphaproteobacteria bacterium]